MKTNKPSIQSLLQSALVPPSLSAMDDASLEALLDEPPQNAEPVPAPVSSITTSPFRRFAFIAIAAAIFILLAVTRHRPSQTESPQEIADLDVPGADAIIISTPPPVEEKLTTVQLEFPKPMFASTPVKIELPNLEKPSRLKVRSTFSAPEGTRLLTKSARVTSSDLEPSIGNLKMIVDGEKDGDDAHYVELGPGLQWVQIDLRGSHEIWGLALWHFHKIPQAYLDVIVEVSDDPKFKKGVVELFNNDHDNSSNMGAGKDPAWVETNHGRLIIADGVHARYIRLYSAGNSANEMNHYVEVEVYGR